MSGTGITTVDGRRIAYQRAGTDGPPVVLLHGGGVDDSRLSWRHTIDAVAEEYRVYAPDWPGYGDSEDGITHTTEAYVDVLAGFLEAVGLERATLAGISMGGAAALGYALERPERVDRLALVDSYGLGREIPAGPFWKTAAYVPGSNAMAWSAIGTSKQATRLGLGNVVANPHNLSDEFVEAVRSRASRPGAGTAFEAFQRNELGPDGTAATSYLEDLEFLSVPTLLVHGAEDPLFPVRWSKRAAAKIPEADLEILDDCGHWTPRERPERFNEILRGFLERESR
ncbi:alpha/beta fold hydrolase [Natrialbaceae archaeon AArc-T1-2]|uniref:alpha/beta fold hydrolase n=1 Tax=Natrialbaceae archaeon AArc-T1-2 TaxID=3053904 RepID=UPI00255ACA18|nr:alpha/beta fold hydrolase [Natrialbaceae archaeon AArc-T1-2]WIV67954.1 alpha/beta fold hydrolase [Natrialbaceae archaeon AArc-T1-2]